MEYLAAHGIPTLPIGYFEHPLPCVTGETTMSVWMPIKEPTTLLGSYRMRTNGCKKVGLIASAVGVPCLPSLPCSGTSDAAFPTASPQLGAASSDQVADASSLRGLVVVAHGLADGPLVLAHLCERLAALGFIVAAPAFSDSANNDQTPMLPFGKRFIAEQTALRMHVLDRCIELLRRMFPLLPLTMVGYSAGSDTIRQMTHVDCARVYMAGPCWMGALAGPTRPLPAAPPPAGRSLQLLTWPDNAMIRFGITKDDSSALTGFPCPAERTLVAAERVTEKNVFARDAGAHFRVDFEPLDHSGLKYTPFREAEYSAYAAAMCGVNPWFPCGRRTEDAAVLELRARAVAGSADAIVHFLLANAEAKIT